MDPAHVARHLGLGPLRRPATVLKADEPHPVCRLSTESGTWVVKVCRPWGDFWTGAAAQAGLLETAAWRAGVDMPEPLLADAGAAGCWRPIGGNRYARAARFIDGIHPTAPFTPTLARWAGTTAASLELLAIAADPRIDSDYTPFPESDWNDWLAQAVDVGVLDRGRAHALKSAAVRINDITASGLASQPVKLVMHRDFSPVNTLVTANGPVLLDFDHAGAQVPWWEAVSIAFGLASPKIGTVAPDRMSVEACLTGYAETGGRIGATDESAFTGMLTGRLSTTAYELWMACGHRGGSPRLRAAYGRTLRASITALTGLLDSTAGWAAWLRA